MEDVLFYPHGYRPDTEPSVGEVIRDMGDELLIMSDGVAYTKPKHETRRPWNPKFFEFWKEAGFPSSYWFHGGVWAFFFLFIF